MNALPHYLADQGALLLAAATCLLALGCAGVALQRTEIHRQRAGELAILGVLAVLTLACVPLPRYRLPALWSADSVVQNSVRPAEPVAIPPPVFNSQDEAVLAEVMVEEEVPLVQSDLMPPGVGTAAEDGGAAVPVLPEVPEPTTAVEPEPLPSTEVVQPPAEADRPTATLGRSASVAPAVDVRYPLAIAYVAGALGCLVWLAFGRVLLVRMLWSARPPEPWLAEIYRRIPYARRHRPKLLISERCARALSFGIWRPAIVLPSDGCGADRAGPLRHVLLHELAHARQRDGWGHLLFNVAFPLLYFHPMYWWLRCRSFLAAELIADDLAAAPAARESYVEALIALAKRGGRVQLAYSSSPQIFGSRSQFYRRMQMLLNRETRLTRRCSPLWRLIYPIACLAAVVLVAGTLGVRPAEAQLDEDPLDADEVVVEAVVAGEDLPNPPAPTDPNVAEGEPIEPEDIGDTDLVEVPLPDEPPEPEVSTWAKDRNALQAERDQLRAQLQALEASVRSLSRMVHALKQQQIERDFPGATAPMLQSDPALGTLISTLVTTPRADDLTGAGEQGKTRSRNPKTSRQPTAPAAPKPTLSLPPLPPPVAPSAPKPPPSEPVLPTPTSPEPRPASTRRVASPLGSVSDRRAPQGTRLDLVRLATSYADVVGELEIAKLEVEGRKELAERRVIPKKEMAIAEIRLKTAQRKLTLLGDVAKSAVMATKAEMEAARKHLDWLKTNGPNDHPAVETMRSEVIRAESRLAILESILGSAGR